MKLTLEMTAELRKQVKSNESVLSIFRKSLVTLYKAYRKKLIDKVEYQQEYNALLYKCALMTN